MLIQNSPTTIIRYQQIVTFFIANKEESIKAGVSEALAKDFNLIGRLTTGDLILIWGAETIKDNLTLVTALETNFVNQDITMISTFDKNSLTDLLHFLT